MGIDFKKLKSAKSGSLDNITKQIDAVTAKSYTEDTRFWSPTKDKAGNASAIIRYLIAPDDDGNGAPFVKYFNHAFKGPGGWYMQNCLTTNGVDDPVCEANTELWNSTDDDNSPIRKLVRDRKRKLNYVANVYIINDSAKPENNGQVRLFKFGSKIFDKIVEATKEEGIDVFNLWEGANFSLKIKTVKDYPNYDSSKFLGKSVLEDMTDKDLQSKVLDHLHELQPLVAPDKFKSYEELEKQLARALGTTSSKKKSTNAEKPASRPADELKSVDSDDSNDLPPWGSDVESDSDIDKFFEGV